MNKVKGVAEKDHGSLKAMKPYIVILGAICMCIAASVSADSRNRLQKLGTLSVINNQSTGQTSAKNTGSPSDKGAARSGSVNSPKAPLGGTPPPRNSR
ncbi:hypothetical protein [Caballeronia mineralivorans]|jgi:hypothetical protein|uniref:hypothetical protein n=1 Tax=Caballeronia mineralivorans TaxID=2010198 RepID=UPI0023F0E9A5|nr:hypothetical protein [Caballeronia mineralivorans]MDB5787878.1 hypothetical protein [Caballeronia mineralivorans]